MRPVRFGTDGWRAVIADGYTFENLNRVSQAAARWIQQSGISENGVVIGYDCRFLSREFARHSAEVFAAMEIPVRIATSVTPTPAVSWAAKKFDAVGIVITASHNPPEYNGFKIKAPFGGSASPEQIAEVEEELSRVTEPVAVTPYKSCLKMGVIRELDLAADYLELLAEGLDLEKIRKSGLRIAHNPMFGSGMGVIRQLLGEQVSEMNHYRDPLFGGCPPEPIEKNLAEFPEFVTGTGSDLGIANDGDADRIAMVDEKGQFVDSHRILSLLVKYLFTKKGLNGSVVKTFSTSDMLNRQAKAYGLPLVVTPIGFKYIAEHIITGDVLAGGEESGGLAVKGHIPERDGIYIGLLIAEMVVAEGKPLSILVQELFDEFGPHEYYRSDILTEERKKVAMIRYCTQQKLKEISGVRVTAWDTTDGIKHLMEDGSWLLVRPSGTEPVLRIYAEASNVAHARKLVEQVCSRVDDPGILEV
ncbi:MAG: phosphoglucomutase/phosphomannomutase family protein [Balneolaceae bacterium]|nr:MAG: phosphoglucomutase/phosphomannomutase family protein [Balneolaceae bacterium]